MKNLVSDSIKLGFGLMRLPKLGDDPMNSPIDVEQCKKMTDAYIAAGGKYFDTAFVYGNSEEATKQFLVDRYPRDSYYLATKLNAAFVANSHEEAVWQFEQSLTRTGAGYIDFYLLHGLDDSNYQKYETLGCWDIVKEQKAARRVKHYGLSWHGSPKVLEQVLTAHPDTEFVQLQINYADWDNASIRAKENYMVTEKFDIPVIVMEPVKGGTLANPPKAVTDIFSAENQDVSAASWAVRFAASLPNVMMVLSGMSNMEQMQDNLSYMKHFKPLTNDEQETIEKAMNKLKSIHSIPCTGCRYCTPGCPIGIEIPKIFDLMNLNLIYGELEKARGDYNWRIGAHKASECSKCGQCETACPQHLPIISYLEKCAETLE